MRAIVFLVAVCLTIAASGRVLDRLSSERQLEPRFAERTLAELEREILGEHTNQQPEVIPVTPEFNVFSADTTSLISTADASVENNFEVPFPSEDASGDHPSLPRIRSLASIFEAPVTAATAAVAAAPVAAAATSTATAGFSLNDVLKKYRDAHSTDSILDDIDTIEQQQNAPSQATGASLSESSGVEEYVAAFGILQKQISATYATVAGLNVTLEAHLRGIVNFDITLAQQKDEFAEAALWVKTKTEVHDSTTSVGGNLDALVALFNELKANLARLKELLVARQTAVAAAGKYVKLLAKQLLEDQATGECLPPDVSQEYSLGNTLSYDEGATHCLDLHTRLCFRNEICRDGALHAPVGGMRGSDNWVPVGDGINNWVSIGNADPATRLCRLHQELPGGYGLPNWGDSSSWPFKGTLLCCPDASADTAAATTTTTTTSTSTSTSTTPATTSTTTPSPVAAPATSATTTAAPVKKYFFF